MHESKILFKSIFNLMPESALILSEDLVPLFLNKNCLKEFGVDIEGLYNLVLSKNSAYKEGELPMNSKYKTFLNEKSHLENISHNSLKTFKESKFQSNKKDKNIIFDDCLTNGMKFYLFCQELINFSNSQESSDHHRKVKLNDPQYLKLLKKSLFKGFLFEDQQNEANYYEVKIILIKINGKLSIYAKIRNIFMDKDLENNSKKEINNFQSKFLSSISHELRTPVNGSISLLQQVKGNIDQKVYKSLIKPSISSLKIMVFNISDILDYSLLLRGGLNIKLDYIDLKKLIFKVHSLIQIQTEIRNLDISIDVPSNIPNIIMNDAHRICQIILNLLTNALKFTNQGFIKIKISVIDEDSTIQVSVQDSGIGISPDGIKKLFKLNPSSIGMIGLGLTISNDLATRLNKFNKGIEVKSEIGVGSIFSITISDFSELNMSLDENDIVNISSLIPSSDHKLKNSGTQLSFNELHKLQQKSDNIIIPENKQEFNNSLEIEQKSINIERKKTATQKLEISNCQLKKIKSFPNISKIELSLSSSNSKSNRLSNINFNLEQKRFYNSEKKIIEKKCNCSDILLVDDNDFNLYALEICLKKYNGKCDKVVNGKEACDKVKRLFANSSCCKEYAIIFMDIDMPVMNGFEATRELKIYFENTQIKSPILACTAFVDEKDIKKCFEAGVDGYLSKPITNEIIEETLNLWFNTM